MAATPKPVRKAVKSYEKEARSMGHSKKSAKMATKVFRSEGKEKFGKGMIESHGKNAIQKRKIGKHREK